MQALVDRTPAPREALTLTSGQQLALAALLRGATHGEAALEAGVPEHTVHGWLQEPLFTTLFQLTSALVGELSLTPRPSPFGGRSCAHIRCP